MARQLWALRGHGGAMSAMGDVMGALLGVQQQAPAVALGSRGLATSSTQYAPRTRRDKEELVQQLLAAKAASGKTFTQIAAEAGLTNAYTAQLFFNQAQLKAETAERLQQAVPGLSNELVAAMSLTPIRSFNPDILQEPLVYRLYEAVTHDGEALKAITNEEFGDGIMSAIDFYCTVGKIKGAGGEDRVLITLNGKFLPHVEQLAEKNTAPGAAADNQGSQGKKRRKAGLKSPSD